MNHYSKQLRKKMVDDQLISRGISNNAVLKAFLEIPREEFVSPDQKDFAYDDRPLPIGADQTISQPYIVALQTEMLNPQPTDQILEIGTGSGYQSAILSVLVQKVVSMEIIPELAEIAEDNLTQAGINNVEVINIDGTELPDNLGKFDKIIVTAATQELPDSWGEHLHENGLLIVPQGSLYSQIICEYKKINGQLELINQDIPVHFVPLTGKFRL